MTPSKNLPAPSDLSRKRRRSFEHRWSYAFIAELNGLADQRRLALQQQDDGAVAAIDGRIQRVVACLAWEPAVALAGAYHFVQEGLDYPEDVCGPATIIAALESDATKISSFWAARPVEIQAFITELAPLLSRLRSSLSP